MKPDLSLVICTLDEADAIAAVLREVDDRLAQITPAVAAEVIVVDDSANEATADAVRAFVPTHLHVRLLRRQGAHGLASAASEGWSAARGRILGLMDGDGQHDPDVLAELLKALEAQGADIAVASRYTAGAHTGLSGFRHALSCSGTALAKLVTGVGTTDPMSGCFLFRREWWEAARDRISPVGYKILLELALSGSHKPKVVEVPTALRARFAGESKLDLRVVADLAAQLIAKSSGGLLSPRFVLFGAVGASGVIVNVATLAAMVRFDAAFWVAETAAVITAMTSNFVLNNLLTFRDRRLTGASLWRGLLTFYGACAGGAFINQTVGLTLHGLGLHGLLAGLTGAMVAALWNYAGALTITWGGQTPRPQAWPTPMPFADRDA
jgi:dolichol-phosphate mannosyltransferase